MKSKSKKKSSFHIFKLPTVMQAGEKIEDDKKKKKNGVVIIGGTKGLGYSLAREFLASESSSCLFFKLPIHPSPKHQCSCSPRTSGLV